MFKTKSESSLSFVSSRHSEASSCQERAILTVCLTGPPSGSSSSGGRHPLGDASASRRSSRSRTTGAGLDRAESPQPPFEIGGLAAWPKTHPFPPLKKGDQGGFPAGRGPQNDETRCRPSGFMPRGRPTADGILLIVLVLLHVASLVGSNGVTATAHASERGDRIEVEGEGEAVIVRQDLLGARNKALDMAKRAAFSMALEEALPTPLALSQQQALVSELVPRINDFLIQYRFEEMPMAGVVFVTVHAVFSRAACHTALLGKGLIFPDQDDRSPEEVFLVMHGVRSPQTYFDIVELLPRKVEGIQHLLPFEIFRDALTLKVLFQGDMKVLEPAVRHALMEIAPLDFAPDGGSGLFVTQVPPARLEAGTP